MILKFRVNLQGAFISSFLLFIFYNKEKDIYFELLKILIGEF